VVSAIDMKPAGEFEVAFERSPPAQQSIDSTR